MQQACLRPALLSCRAVHAARQTDLICQAGRWATATFGGFVLNYLLTYLDCCVVHYGIDLRSHTGQRGPGGCGNMLAYVPSTACIASRSLRLARAGTPQLTSVWEEIAPQPHNNQSLMKAQVSGLECGILNFPCSADHLPTTSLTLRSRTDRRSKSPAICTSIETPALPF